MVVWALGMFRQDMSRVKMYNRIYKINTTYTLNIPPKTNIQRWVKNIKLCTHNDKIEAIIFFFFLTE